MTEPQYFSCVAMFLLLFSAFVFNFYGHSPGHRKFAGMTAIAGGLCMLVAGIIYRDPFIIFMEVSFMSLNIYGVRKSSREEKENAYTTRRLESIDEHA